ncbi:cellulose binding domain-containing protein [Amycolatopsis sp. lyj-346]|uniref:cellulose binding domain-containing protein n=1 Tax=Amycolatopsis sp. lyj-346 TaxID=2789289 RepID=UPI00397BF7C4
MSVDELLRETGAMPRSLGAYVPLTRAREDDTGAGYRERLEQRAREAAAGQQRAGQRIRWVSALCGGVVVVGSLVIIAVTSESSPGRQAGLAADPLAPATTPRTVATSAAPRSAPVPTVLRQTSTSATPETTAPKTTATSQTQAPAPPAPVASCSVRYAVTDQWNNGFTGGVKVTNTGNQTLSPWTATWNFTAGQRVTHSWNGDYAQSGSRVVMKAVSYNLTLAPGATVDIGFNASFDRVNPAPVGFTLNGARCRTN